MIKEEIIEMNKASTQIFHQWAFEESGRLGEKLPIYFDLPFTLNGQNSIKSPMIMSIWVSAQGYFK